jgi:hypothetical protein
LEIISKQKRQQTKNKQQTNNKQITSRIGPGLSATQPCLLPTAIMVRLVEMADLVVKSARRGGCRVNQL